MLYDLDKDIFLVLYYNLILLYFHDFYWLKRKKSNLMFCDKSLKGNASLLDITSCLSYTSFFLTIK